MAFGAERGRLWVVCRKCERWNLRSPTVCYCRLDRKNVIEEHRGGGSTDEE